MIYYTLYSISICNFIYNIEQDAMYSLDLAAIEILTENGSLIFGSPKGFSSKPDMLAAIHWTTLQRIVENN